MHESDPKTKYGRIKTKFNKTLFFSKIPCFSNLQQLHTRSSKQQKYSSNNSIGNNNNNNYSNNNIDNDDDNTTTTDKNLQILTQTSIVPTITTIQTTVTMTRHPQQLKQQH